MKTTWTANAHNKAELKQAYGASSVIRKRLSLICSKKIEGGFVLTKDDYNSHNWQYRQADAVGYRRALEEVISLLSD